MDDKQLDAIKIGCLRQGFKRGVRAGLPFDMSFPSLDDAARLAYPDPSPPRTPTDEDILKRVCGWDEDDGDTVTPGILLAVRDEPKREYDVAVSDDMGYWDVCRFDHATLLDTDGEGA